MSSPLANPNENVSILNQFDLNDPQQQQQQQPSLSNFRNINIGNINTSLTSSMMNLSLSNGLASLPPLYKLKLRNLPNDITLREAYTIFSLSNDLVNVEIIHESLNLLNGIVEPSSAGSSIGDASQSPAVAAHHHHQAPPQAQQQQYIPVIIASFKSAVSAQSIASFLNHKQIFGPNSIPITTELDDLLLSTTSSSIVPSPSLNPSLANNAGLSNNNSESNFNKRPSIVTQKSRFLFNDPFNIPSSTSPVISSTVPPQPVPLNQPQTQQPQQPQSHQQQAQTQQQQHQHQAAAHQAQADLVAGKSLLMMEAQNDAREYEQLVRWGSHAGIPSSQAQVPSGSITPQYMNLQQQQQQQPQQQGPPSQAGAPQQPQQPMNDWDRRRASSFYMQGQQQPQQPQQASQNNPGSQRVSIAQQASGMVPTQQASQQQQQQQQPPQQQIPSSQASQQTPQQQPQQAQQHHTATNNISDIPELSLLARVPAPVNPADQNPPCNTLYVGNLPPDATEAELRALFAPQQGFRRLSFRTKAASMNGMNSGHNHGPMCFVEFEDVSLATIALAELYGKALPNRALNGGKGIRLSFSKNPLGVRGPARNNSVITNGGQMIPPNNLNNSMHNGNNKNGHRYSVAS